MRGQRRVEDDVLLAGGDRGLLAGSGRRSGARPGCRRAGPAAAPPSAHLSCAFQQRVRKRQPDGGLIGEGTSPASRIRSRPLVVRVGLGHGGQQRVGVRVARARCRWRRRSPISTILPRYITATRCEKCRTIARSCAMKRKAMPSSPLELLQQVDDLRLDGDVQRGDRLVRDDQLRLQGERAGDADALPLAAGELVREAVVVLGVEADGLQQLADPVLPAAGRVDAVDLHRRRR